VPICNRRCFSAALALAGLIFPSTRLQAADADQPIRALLIVGGCCHDYPKQKDLLTKGISARANVEWKIAFDTDTTHDGKNPIYNDPDWSKGFDVIVHDECTHNPDLKLIEGTILPPHRAGLPAVVLHCGMHSYRSEGWPDVTTPWYAFTGLPSSKHGKLAPIAIHFTDPDSPITKGCADWTTVNEELYNNHIGKPLDTAHALARGKQNDKDSAGKSVTNDYVVAWTNIYHGKTRVFGTTIGHTDDTVADPRYLNLVTRGLLWAVDKLDDAHLKPAK
jgi:hypothetical protein